MFDLKRPCSNCPFLKDGGIRLTRQRTRDIAREFLDPNGGTFHCHKTVERDDDGEETSSKDAQMCMGGVLFAYKQGVANQMVRIGSRTGFDIDAVTGGELVFSSLDAMLRAALDRGATKSRRRR